MRKEIDGEILRLIDGGVKARHRSLFMILGDNYHEKVVILHSLLKTASKSDPSVLWCSKRKLKRTRKRRNRSGRFSSFIENARCCLYKDSERILGNTYDICVLQDIEGLTPNILARTVETVVGGGLVIVLLRSLCTHKDGQLRLQKESSSRFVARFLLSLSLCRACLVVDELMNILPISTCPSKSMVDEGDESLRDSSGKELSNLKEEFVVDDFPVCPLIGLVKTLDQGKAILYLLHAVFHKESRKIIALTGPRGRGKSAALGLAVAGAIALGYSNIFVVAPTPQDSSSLFEFILRGLDVLEYERNSDYDVKGHPVITEINIHKQHRQTVQYIQPCNDSRLFGVELLVIEEAAAIPLPIIHSLLGKYVVFLSSTVSGYEGTGFFLLSNLLMHIEKENRCAPSRFRRLELMESVRYASGDPIESWMTEVLCLDATNSVPIINKLSHPDACKLQYIDKDMLFSFGAQSEILLKRIISLIVAYEDKYSPDYLQYMADTPSHHLFVLFGPDAVDESNDILPDILCVIQVCLEGWGHFSSWGHFSKDQIASTFYDEFEDTTLLTLTGLRIVRIAGHPNFLELGYGPAAMSLLTRVLHLRNHFPEQVDYLATSFGLTHDLLRFWKEQNFLPFFISDIQDNRTGEFTCVVAKLFEQHGSQSCMTPFYTCFKQRFLRRLSSRFRDMDYKLAMAILDPKLGSDFSDDEVLPSAWTKETFSLIDLKILGTYVVDMRKLSQVQNILPPLADYYFQEKLPISLDYQGASILLILGLQLHTLPYIKEKMKMEEEQISSILRRAMCKFYNYLSSVL